MQGSEGSACAGIVKIFWTGNKYYSWIFKLSSCFCIFPFFKL